MAINPRNIRVAVNGNMVKDTVMNYYNDLVFYVPVCLPVLSTQGR